MSKAKAKARKKARLAKLQAAASAPKKEAHEQGEDHIPADMVEEKVHPGKFDAKSPPGGFKNTSGKNIPNLAASTRGSARSR